MYLLRPALQAQLRFVDRDARRAQLTLSFAAGISFATAIAATEDAITALEPLTDALIPSYAIRRVWLNADQSAPTSGERVGSALALFYRNAGNSSYEAFYVPAPKASLFEPTGDYAGIRALASAAELVYWSTDAAINLASVLTPSGDPWPTDFIVGGRVL